MGERSIFHMASHGQKNEMVEKVVFYVLQRSMLENQ